MGVPELLRAVAIKFGVNKIGTDVFSTLNIDAMYFDLASVIHTAAQETFAYGAFQNEKAQIELAKYSEIELATFLYENIKSRLETAILTVRPKKLVYIAMDGVPVYAKTVQQRWRRFSSHSSILFD
jgi:5'-3' exonuclease